MEKNKSIIEVKDVTKIYKVVEKKPGFFNSIKMLCKKDYKEKIANNSISFNIENGEFVGLIGPNGAGKSTLIKMMTGIIRPTKGSVRILDQDPNKASNSLKSKIALVMGQKSQLWWDLPAYDTLLLNRAIYGINDEDFLEKISYFEDIFGLHDIMYIPVRQLSLGQRMKMEIVSCLLHNPQVIFLDEPTIGLDVIAQTNIRKFLKQVNLRLKTTIILTSHNMEDISDLCNRVIVINQGQKLYDGQLSILVKKYCNSKKITIFLEKESKQMQLDDVKWLKKEPFMLCFEVSQNRINSILLEVVKKYKIQDISIEDESLSTIIERIYQNRNMSI